MYMQSVRVSNTDTMVALSSCFNLMNVIAVDLVHTLDYHGLITAAKH
jgi:hypothetical protein